MNSINVRPPEYLLFEAKRETQFITGSEAVKEAVRRANIDMAISYPITPQSESMHLVGDLYAEGYIKDYFRGENEFAVMSEVSGASFGGVRVFTATCGPGTMRAFELFPMWAGARLPIVCAFMTRGVNAPLTIQPDNIEMGFLLETGLLMVFAETAQDIYDMLLASFMVAEEKDVHLPVGVFMDGFFITHTREQVRIISEDVCLPPYNPKTAPVAVMDMETPPFRLMRDPFVMKSNFVSYAAHASWQQEVRAAAVRSKKHFNKYLKSPLEIENPSAEIMIVAGGTAVSQAREAIVMTKEDGIDVGLVKLKLIRPFPSTELALACAGAKKIFIPEFNIAGWLAKEVASIIPDNSRIIGAPRVYGGMTMPPELIVETIKKNV